MDRKRALTIKNRLGLHARASAELVKVTNQFKCRVTLSKGSLTVDGKSILGIMSLAAGIGSEVTVYCEGDDALHALNAITVLFEDRFGEDA